MFQIKWVKLTKSNTETVAKQSNQNLVGLGFRAKANKAATKSIENAAGSK